MSYRLSHTNQFKVFSYCFRFIIIHKNLLFFNMKNSRCAKANQRELERLADACLFLIITTSEEDKH